MIRDLGQPVSAIDVEEDSIIAGGWDGSLKKWNSDGDLLWAAQCNDRIEAILRIDDYVIVTSGLHITCVKDGEILWSNALEGSADLLAFHNGEVIATSSVYDIEHGDFMESAVWTFTLEGEQVRVTRLDERPWFINADKNLILGLGRPKCGILFDGEYQSLSSDAPVTCGLSGRKHILFGHADGTISSLSGKQICKESSSVESLSCSDQGFVAALESGMLVAMTPQSDELWRAEGAQITTQAAGFDGLHWCGRWASTEGLLEIRNSEGELVVSANTTRPRVSDASINRIGFGFEDGQILVWEKELFTRRSTEEVVENDSRKSALAARLRSLRK